MPVWFWRWSCSSVTHLPHLFLPWDWTGAWVVSSLFSPLSTSAWSILCSSWTSSSSNTSSIMNSVLGESLWLFEPLPPNCVRCHLNLMILKIPYPQKKLTLRLLVPFMRNQGQLFSIGWGGVCGSSSFRQSYFEIQTGYEALDTGQQVQQLHFQLGTRCLECERL